MHVHVHVRTYAVMKEQMKQPAAQYMLTRVFGHAHMSMHLMCLLLSGLCKERNQERSVTGLSRVQFQLINWPVPNPARD